MHVIDVAHLTVFFVSHNIMYAIQKSQIYTDLEKEMQFKCPILKASESLKALRWNCAYFKQIFLFLVSEEEKNNFSF